MAVRKRKGKAAKGKTVTPVKVNAAVQKQYRDRLQAANQQYKKQVDKKVNSLLAQINKLDRSKPDAYQKQAEKIVKSISGLQRNLEAANKRSIKAVQQFTAKAERENLRRTKNSFGKHIDSKLIEMQLAEKQAIVKKRIASLEKTYIDSITSANRDYSDRVQQALYAKLGNKKVNARKIITRSRGIVTRRIKNTVQNQAHEINATMNRTRQAALGAKKYLWQTKEDEVVRKTHRLHNKKIFSWAKRPAPTGHPGEDHGCRCIAIPVL